MQLNVEKDYKAFLMLVCLFKIYHDVGITCFERLYYKDIINDFDYYYEYVLEAIENAAPIVVYGENLYKKHGFDPDDGEPYIYAYSSEEMQEYFKFARKLHRLEGGAGENPYEREIQRKISGIQGFFSYNFDYCIGHKRKGAWLEALWWPEFSEEIAMCLWIVRVMKMFKEELPKLREKYRAVRRLKRAGLLKKGGPHYAAA